MPTFVLFVPTNAYYDNIIKGMEKPAITLNVVGFCDFLKFPLTLPRVKTGSYI